MLGFEATYPAEIAVDAPVALGKGAKT
jgi:ribose transport system substrate-binding protein